MAYDVTDTRYKPALIANGIGGGRQMWWMENIDGDAEGVVIAEDYVSDGVRCGLRDGDLLMHVTLGANPADAPAMQFRVVSVNETTGLVTLSAGQAVG